MLKQTKLIVLVGLVLVFAASAAWASYQRIAWIPDELKPESIAPGESRTFTLTLKNRADFSRKTKGWKVVAEGGIAPFVAVTQPNFPPKLKKGETVTFTLTVSVPTGTPMSVKTGELELKRPTKKGKLKDVRRADELPVELTFSPIPLPPDPGEVGKATVEGIITNPFKIRDEILRHIVFAFPKPEDEPRRNAFIQYAQADQKMSVDFLALRGDPVEQKRVVRLDSKLQDAADDCMSHVFEVHGLRTYDERLVQRNAIDDAAHATDLVFLNTKERSRIYNKADALLGGTTGDPVTASEQAAHDAAACDQNLLD